MVFSWVLHGANANDRSLALHQSGHGMDRANGSGVSQRDGGASEVINRELVGSRTTHDVLVGGPELRKVHLVAELHRWNQQLPRTIGLGDVNC